MFPSECVHIPMVENIDGWEQFSLCHPFLIKTHTEMTRLSQPWHKVARMLFYNLGTTLYFETVARL